MQQLRAMPLVFPKETPCFSELLLVQSKEQRAKFPNLFQQMGAECSDCVLFRASEVLAEYIRRSAKGRRERTEQ